MERITEKAASVHVATLKADEKLYNLQFEDDVEMLDQAGIDQGFQMAGHNSLMVRQMAEAVEAVEAKSGKNGKSANVFALFALFALFAPFVSSDIHRSVSLVGQTRIRI